MFRKAFDYFMFVIIYSALDIPVMTPPTSFPQYFKWLPFQCIRVGIENQFVTGDEAEALNLSTGRRGWP